MSNRKSNFARAHNISLPSTKRKLNIDEATSALSSMGYRMGTVRHSLADKTSYWSVTTPTGSVVEVAANKLTDFVYGKIKNLNAQRYTETTYEVLFPDEDEDTQFIDSKEAAIKVARQYAAKGCTVELSQVTKTWRSKSEADAAQIPTNTKETPMRFFKGLNMNSTGTKAKFGDYYNNPADSSKKVNKLLPRIVAAIKAAGGQVDSVEKHESKSSASIRFPTKGDYQVSIDIGSTYLAVNRYVIRGAGVLQSVHLFNGELSDIDKAVAIAVNEWKKLKAARRHFSRVGAKAKFGEVENLLNMISDQMNSGNNDLAKTNLRKLAAKIGEIRHTRSEWDQFMTVAKSLGFTESQIGGFSRRGSKMRSKMTKSTYAISPLQEMANKVQRLWDQYNLLADRAEETKIAARTAYRAYLEAKRILDDAPRPAGVPKYDLPQRERNSRGLSRTGGKANFAAELRQWESYFKEDAAVTLWDASQLLRKIKDKKAELKQAEGNIAEGRAMLKSAVATQNTAQYFRANKILDIADGVRSAFSRTGAKATHAASVNDPRSISDTDTQIDWLLTEAESAMRHINKGSQRNLIVRQQIAEIPSLMRSNTNPRLIVRLKALKQAAGITTFARTGAKATHAQVNIESKGVGSYYNSHLKEPRGTGSWSFIAPDGSILSAPRQMTLQAAKSWLKQNATINGYYKVAP